MTTDQTATPRPDVDAAERAYAQAGTMNEVDIYDVVALIPGLIAYIRTLEAEAEQNVSRSTLAKLSEEVLVANNYDPHYEAIIRAHVATVLTLLPTESAEQRVQEAEYANEITRQVATIRDATNNKLETAALIAWKYDHWMMTNLAESNRYQTEVVEAIRSLKEQAS